METKTTKIEVDKNIYIAIDGKEFNSSWDCERYEERFLTEQALSKIKQKYIYVDEFNLPSTFYYISNDEELKFIKKYFRYTSHTYFNHKHESGTINIGDWIGCVIEDGGDYNDTINFYTLEYVIDYIQDFYIAFKQSIQDLK